MGLVDLGVGVIEVEDGVHLGRRAVDVHRHRTVLPVLAQEDIAAVVPLDVEPHPASFGVAGDELVARQVGHL